jgi:outer membrane protein TolC
MKTRFAVVAMIAVASLYMLQAQSDEHATQETKPTFNAAPIKQDLLDTLAQAFKGRFAEYNDGQVSPDNVIRLNNDLFDAQVSSVNAAGRHAVARDYVARAQQIEEIAAKKLDTGTGLSTELLEAKASRLKAQLELEKLQN